MIVSMCTIWCGLFCSIISYLSSRKHIQTHTHTHALSFYFALVKNLLLLFWIHKLMLWILSIKWNTNTHTYNTHAHTGKFIWYFVGKEQNKSSKYNNSRYVHGCNRINKLCFCDVLYIHLLSYVLNKVEALVSKCAHCIYHPFFQFLIYSMCIEIVRLRIVVHTIIDENKQASKQAKNQRTDIAEWIAFLVCLHTNSHSFHSLSHSLTHSFESNWLISQAASSVQLLFVSEQATKGV